MKAIRQGGGTVGPVNDLEQGVVSPMKHSEQGGDGDPVHNI